jgi:hypothetical protein
MEYLHSDNEAIFRCKTRGGWHSFFFIPKKQDLVIRKGYSGDYAVYFSPTTNEMYRNTQQVSYPKSE